MNNFMTKIDIDQQFKNIECYNGCIKLIDITLIGHFNNVVTISCPTDYNDNRFVDPFYGYSCTKNVGFILQQLFDLFDYYKEDGISLSSCKNIPCRVLFDQNKCIGIGNFMKDKYLIIDQLFEVK